MIVGVNMRRFDAVDLRQSSFHAKTDSGPDMESREENKKQEIAAPSPGVSWGGHAALWSRNPPVDPLAAGGKVSCFFASSREKSSSSNGHHV